MGAGALSKKTCLVTGASRGLGRAVAERFWSEGASLVLAVRDPASVATLVSSFAREPDRTVVVVPLDLLDGESTRSLASRVEALGVGRLDVLVNNAAVLGPVGKAADNAPAE